MVNEIAAVLQPRHGGLYIDMTFGAGGHTKKLLESRKDITVIAVDRDYVAYEKALSLAKDVSTLNERWGTKQSVIPVHGKFSEVLNKLHLYGVNKNSVDGIIMDLGASSIQYDDPIRGFSISHNGPLDMRMDRSNRNHDITAADVVNTLDSEELAKIFKAYGEERRSRKIASAIVDLRFMLKKLATTEELARVVMTVCPVGTDALGRFSHPATRTFQALRIFVNNELNELNYALTKMREFLKCAPGNVDDSNDEARNSNEAGRAAVLTFHSLEDRIVKRHLTGVDLDEPIVRRLSQHARLQTNVIESTEILEEVLHPKFWQPLSKHVAVASDEEVMGNPRSRSAKLRIAQRIG
ncbi:putative methyltransferase-like protein 15-like protein, partial [Fragariocoptes setiger]